MRIALSGLIGRLRISTAKAREVNVTNAFGTSSCSTMHNPPHHAAKAAAISMPLSLTTPEM